MLITLPDLHAFTNSKPKITAPSKPANAVKDNEGPVPHVAQPSPHALELLDSWTSDKTRRILRLQEAQHGQSMTKANTLMKMLQLLYDLIECEQTAFLELSQTD